MGRGLHGENEDGDYVAGIVPIEPICTSRTRVNLKLFYDSNGSPGAEEFLSSIGHRVAKRTCKGLEVHGGSGVDIVREGILE